MDQIELRTKVLEALEKVLRCKSRTMKTEMEFIELRHLMEVFAFFHFTLFIFHPKMIGIAKWHIQRPTLSIPGVTNTLSRILLLAKFLCMKYPLLARGLIEEYQEQKYFTWTPKDSCGTRKMLDSNGDELVPDFPLQLVEQYNAQIACAKESVDKFREQRIHKIADLLCFFILQLGFTRLDDARKCLKSYKRLKYELAIVTLLTNYPMVPFLGNLATTLPQL